MPQRVIVKCGCSRVVNTYELETSSGTSYTVERAGECEECTANGGRYDRSSAWKEEKPVEVDNAQLSKFGDDFKKRRKA